MPDQVNMSACSLGEQLDALGGVDLQALSGQPVAVGEQSRQAYPPVLILDSSRIGSISATGQVKKRLFEGWPGSRLLQVHAVGRSALGLYRGWEPPSAPIVSVDAAVAGKGCHDFCPDVIYYRPHEGPVAFHRWAEDIIDRLGAPVVTHLMDDWIRRSGSNTESEKLLRSRLQRSAACLSVGEAMSAEFEDRYGVAFQPIANCVAPHEWLVLEERRKRRKAGEPATVRYVGALADDMTCASVVDVARAIDGLHDELGLTLEVHTMDRWLISARRALARLRGVSVHGAKLCESAHRQLLVDSDVLLIAYNFDEASMGYVRYSIANKMPECLAAAVPVLAYGPCGLATIDYLAIHGIAEVITERDTIALPKALRRLVTDTEYAAALGRRARDFAFARHSCDQVRKEFHRVLSKAAGRHGWTPDNAPVTAHHGGLLGSFERAAQAHFDEVRWVGKVLGGRTDGVMVDVGAHHGRVLAEFLDRGWRVFAFEPDGANRARLEACYGNRAELVIDPRAVSDTAQVRVPFFTSGESTGISTLSPFRDSHKPVGVVETTTIKQALQQYGIGRIDLLKIDAEGYDLMVLKGVPWEAVRPEVVVCEFEDRKTRRLGYGVHDMAQYLIDRGYWVWLSEWHPVVRYGIQHDWRRLVPYPCHLSSPDAWGNLVAFQHVMPDEMLRKAAKTVLKVFALQAARKAAPVPVVVQDSAEMSNDPAVRKSVVAEGAVTSSGALSDKGNIHLRTAPWAQASLRERLASYLLRHHPYVARIARFAVWNLRTICRRPVLVGLYGLLLAGSLLALVWMGESRILPLWTTVAATCVFFGMAALGKIEEVEHQLRGLKSRIDMFEGGLAKLNGRSDALEQSYDKLYDEVHNAFATSDAACVNVSGRNAPVPYSAERRLTIAEIKHLQGYWLPRFGLCMSAEALTYMAHRVAAMEDRCVGRLEAYVSTEVLRCLAARAVAGKSLEVLKIGANFGMDIACIHDLCYDFFERLHLTVIVPPDDVDGKGKLDRVVRVPVTRGVLTRNLRTAGIADSDYAIIPCGRGDTEAIARASVRNYDLLIIGCDHGGREEIAGDFFAYRGMVKTGGFIVFDDYAVAERPAVQGFVDEELLGREDLELVGVDWHIAIFKVSRATSAYTIG